MPFRLGKENLKGQSMTCSAGALRVPNEDENPGVEAWLGMLAPSPDSDLEIAATREISRTVARPSKLTKPKPESLMLEWFELKSETEESLGCVRVVRSRRRGYGFFFEGEGGDRNCGFV